MGGPATQVCEQGTAGAKFNHAKNAHYVELTACDVLFHDRTAPALKNAKEEVIRPETPGRSYPAVFIRELKSIDERGYDVIDAELRVNFGGMKGWESVIARKGARKEGFWYEPMPAKTNKNTKE